MPDSRRSSVESTGARIRRAALPPLLMTTTPLVVLVLWMICFHYDGSIAQFVSTIDVPTFWRLVPRPSWSATAILVFWFAMQSLLLRVLPGPDHLGPTTPTGSQPRYRLNGVAAWVVTHVGLALAWWAGLWSPATVYREFGSMLVELTGFAFALCVWLYWKGRNRPCSRDVVVTGDLAFDLFMGVELHPTMFGMSLKQLCNCRFSMMGWSVLSLCFLGYQYETYGFVASSLVVSSGLVVAYLFKFFVWEGGYFNSLDIMHDRFGYYICWGVLVWVPGLYTIPGQYLATHPVELSLGWALALAAIGVAALIINYAADEQRKRIRATNGRTLIWGRPPRTLVATYTTSDGQVRENLLLVSGYWGIARHFHYVPELTLALCWSLPAGPVLVPYAYFVFLTMLLVDRADRDDRRCAAKYGATWTVYRKLVPFKILPGIY